MSKLFEKAYEEVKQLVRNFEENKASYMKASYQEAEVRQDFIDKFFTAFGWDVAHQHQTNPYKQEVKIEKNVKTGHSQRRADYAFSITPNFRDVKFYVEAKKPSVELESKDVYFQIIRYGWNSKTPIGVVTDFEQFHVVDCRYRPNINTALDQKVKGLQFYYTDYLDKDKFAKIYWLFSREAVADNSIEDFADKLPKRRGKAVQKGFFRTGIQDIDESFIEDLDSFRADLAHVFKKTDSSLDGLALTEMVQRTIDRLVFLRFLEDKLIEINYRISDFGNSGSCWRDFIAASRKLDGIYNGVVFKEHDLLDDKNFNVDGAAFSDICEKLSHDHTPYDFNIIPIHILGSIYERFLGKVIVATAKKASIEEKPEVRKAGGVYYTPEYIVRYITKNTIGKLVDGKHPNEIAKMRFADISCGSGSFLLGIYDYLLEYHRQWYNDNLKQPRKSDCYKHEDGTLHLTLEKKREILLNNIYGVDIDHQAVEVAQLSLYLKLLEEETTASANQFLLNFEQERQRKQLLPSLNNNVKCGNSLIGPDFYDQQVLVMDDAEHRRINVFDWESAFPEIFSGNNPGFDAIVGNPPYGAMFSDLEKSYLFSTYRSIKGQPESYEYFMEKALSTSNKKGYISYIIPTNFVESLRARELRKSLLTTCIHLVSSFRYNVWTKNAAEVLVIVLQKGVSPNKTLVVHPHSPQEFITNKNGVYKTQKDWHQIIDQRFLLRADAKLIGKIERDKVKLEELCEISQGIIVYKTREEGLRNLYIADKRIDPQWGRLLDTKSTIQRYSLTWGKRYLKYGEWLWCPRESKFFNRPKIVFVRLRNKSLNRKLVGTYDEKGYYNRDNFNNIILKKNDYSLKYLLGIFNSNLLNYWYKAYFDNVNINPAQIKLLPIRDIDFSKSSDVKKHDQMVNLVDRMMELHKKFSTAKVDADKNMFQSQIKSTDWQIDKLVYKLYDLTDEEIAIVESSTGS